MIQVGKYYNFNADDDVEAFVLFVNKNVVLYVDKAAGESNTEVFFAKELPSTFEYYFEEITEERNWAEAIDMDDIKDE